MMNDRFAADLRRHLIETADERPGEGQLASVIDGVASTTQRHPVVARLAWSPRIAPAPFPSASLRYAVVALALIGALIAAAVWVGGPRARSTVFEGTWRSTDTLDRSNQTLVVGPGATPTIHFVDDYATGGACESDVVKIFTADGTGRVTGNRMEVEWPDGGGCGTLIVGVDLAIFTYDQAADSLTDDQEITWLRTNDTDVPPTPGPTPEDTTRDPGPDPNCIQFDEPGAYSARAGTLSLTVDVPGTALAPWLGHRDRFHMLHAACADLQGQGMLEAAEITTVSTDACDAPPLPVGNAAEAAAALSGAPGLVVVGQGDVALGGYPGIRLELTVPTVATTCPNGQIPVADGLNPLDLGMSFTLYLIDVQGRTLALGLYGSSDWDQPVADDVDAILASLQIEATELDLPPTQPAPTSSAPAATATALCSDLPAGATYRQPVGGLSVALTVPGDAAFEWDGYRDEFEVSDACLLQHDVTITAAIVREVYATCDSGIGVTVSSAAEAVAALTSADDYVSEPTDVTVGAYAAKRFEVSSSESTCPNAIDLWPDAAGLPGTTRVAYVVDVGGVALGVIITDRDGAAPTAQVAEAAAMVASMEIEP